MPKTGSSGDKRILAKNRRARHNYEILDSLEAGIVLLGTEVKAVRDGRVQLRDGYVTLKDGEAYLIGAYIGPYPPAAGQNHDPDRDRKLLLRRREIDKFLRKSLSPGLTCIPLVLYRKGPLIKVEIGLARGLRKYDKREKARERELDREAERAIRRDRPGSE